MSVWKPKDRSGRELWRFACKSLRFLLASQRINTSARAIIQPTQYSRLKPSFQAAFSSYRSTSLLSPSLYTAILSTPDEVLQLWLSELVRTEVQAEIQGQGVKAWVSSWLLGPISLPELPFIPAKSPVNEWISAKITVSRVVVGVMQSSQRSGDVQKGISLEMQEIEADLRANPAAGSLIIKQISLQTWSKSDTISQNDCLTAKNREIPQVNLTFGPDFVSIGVILDSPVLTYSADLQKQIVMLSSSLDFSADESEAVRKTAQNLNSMSKAAYYSLASGSKQQVSIQVTDLSCFLRLSRNQTVKLAVPLLAFSLFSHGNSPPSLSITEASLSHINIDQEATLLPSISAHVDFSSTTLAIVVDSSVNIAISSANLISLQAVLRQDLEPEISSLLQSEKLTIMRSAVVKDLVDRGNTRFYAVLSGAYVYFFARPEDLVPSSYFYVRNCLVVTQGLCELRVVSDVEDCEMRFMTETRREAWVTALQTHIEDRNRDSLVPQPRENRAKDMLLTANIPNLRVQIDGFTAFVEGINGKYKETRRSYEWEIDCKRVLI